MIKLKELFRLLISEPNKNIDSENQENRIRKDFSIFESKRVLKEVVFEMQTTMYSLCKSGNGGSTILEIGAGALPMKLSHPNVVATDIVLSENIDKILDATSMELENNSIDGLILQNTFHHIPDPSRFFSECYRVLKPGGRVVILDPYHNVFSKFVYPKLFATEKYDLTGTWNEASSHAMVGANQALSYIVFSRDLNLFKMNNPSLRVVSTQPVSQGLRYFASGGLNFRQILPSPVFPILRRLEQFGFIKNQFSIHWIVVLEKMH